MSLLGPGVGPVRTARGTLCLVQRYRSPWLHALAALAALVASVGCKERPRGLLSEQPDASFMPQSTAAGDGGSLDSPWLGGESLVIIQRAEAMGGEEDIDNRYLGTVRVSARHQAKVTRCSGTVLGRRLVLTAGHCVCAPHLTALPGDEAGTAIDTSDCAERATIGTLVYQHADGGLGEAGFSTNIHGGIVRPHPGLRVLLDARGTVVESLADLAVIVLDHPLGDEESRPIPLADAAVQPGEVITIVGHGYDEIANVVEGVRRFSRNQVSRILESPGGRVLFRQPGGHVYKGDSGGPCLRESARGVTLVGVSSRGLGEGASFTSTHGYEGWLREELQRVKEAPAWRP